MKINLNISNENAQKYAEKLIKKEFPRTIFKHLDIDCKLFVFETTTKFGLVTFKISVDVFKQNKVRKPEILRTMFEALYKAFI